mmetsp:Transcript_21657/g.71647  ORF Transcript_21657/g.71647 Transcript_21657/m.71647 type:complete len:213 (-) Transcript_21657:1700-2338(-)
MWNRSHQQHLMMRQVVLHSVLVALLHLKTWVWRMQQQSQCGLIQYRDGLVTVYQFACGNDVVTTTRLRAVSLGVLPARVLILGAFDRMARSVLCFSDRACVVRRGCASHLQWVVASAKAFGETTEWRYYIVVPLHKKATTAILACGSQFAICKIDANQGIKVVSVPLAEQPCYSASVSCGHVWIVNIRHRKRTCPGCVYAMTSNPTFLPSVR